MHIVAAKAVAFGEALRPRFKDYQAQVLRNTVTLGEELKNAKFNLVSGGTDNHLLVDLTSKTSPARTPSTPSTPPASP